MNKRNLVDKIIADLTAKVELHVSAARTARAEATAEDNKAEDQYDTRGLEASYLAAGQSRQTAEIQQAISDFQGLAIGKFGAKTPIDVGALVELQPKGEDVSLYFIGPSAGGTEVVQDRKTVLVLTPQSPLGQQLIGRMEGERMKFRIGGRQNEYRVVSVR